MQRTPELPEQWIRERLAEVDTSGWGSAAGEELLARVRQVVVQPVVRRQGLRGPAAQQAQATGWAVAWEVLQGPSVRAAQNPAGMIWVAVRRAVAREVAGDRSAALELVGSMWPDASVEVWDAYASPWMAGPAERKGSDLMSLPDSQWLGWRLEQIVAALAEVGWTTGDARDAIAMLVDVTDRGPGLPAASWRGVAHRLGLALWRVRRLAALVLGAQECPGLLALITERGCGILSDPQVAAALRATTDKRLAGPEHYLEPLACGEPTSRPRSGQGIGSRAAASVLSTGPLGPRMGVATIARGGGADCSDPAGGFSPFLSRGAP